MTEAQHVCWDEAHFGKFAGWYINRTFFFDVHPPLGKMMIAGIGHITGYNASFGFEKPGEKYEDHNVYGMRIGSTLVGTLIIPIGFLTVWSLTRSISASTLSSMLLVCDGGMAVLNRFILLDPFLLVFMSASVLANIRFRSLGQDQQFSTSWWSHLALTGVMLSCTMSVKFVGLFVIVFVGVNTIYDLWMILGDTNTSWTHFIHHFLARAACLIVLPVILYMMFFAIHFHVLYKSGGGDGHYSPRFQSTLEGNFYQDLKINKYVEFGSNVTIKSSSMPCGYLHSHDHFYPEGLSNGLPQQIVSNYLHRDDNNVFILKPWNSSSADNIVRHGDLVLVEHLNTRKHVHSHREKALVAGHHYQVTGYGEDGVGDDNDVWRIEIAGGRVGDKVEAITSSIKIRHHYLNCLLTCTNEPFPSNWGFGQGEVACSPWQRQTKESKGMRLRRWFIDENNVTDTDDDRNPRIEVKSMKPGFLEKFLESHRVMFWINSRLSDSDYNAFDWKNQIPIRWPTNLISQPFSPFEPRMYLLGNPRIWILNLVILILFPLILFHRLVRSRETKTIDMFNQDQYPSPHVQAATTMFTLWSINYFPYFLMSRVLYFHHYYPALYFSSLLSGIFIDWTLKSLIKTIPKQLSPMMQVN